MIAATSPYVVPLGALVVSVAALLYGVIGSKQKAENDLMAHLYDRIADLEKQAESCSNRCKDLERRLSDMSRENFSLMRRLLKLESEG